MRRTIRLISLCALSFALLLHASISLAGPRGANPPGRPAAAGRPSPAARVGKVDLQVMAIAATNAHSRTDPRLGKLGRTLQNLRYSGYDYLDSQSFALNPSSTESFSVAEGHKVTVTLVTRDERGARVRVQVSGDRGKVVDSTVTVSRNGTFIVAGPKHGAGILILAVSARY